MEEPNAILEEKSAKVTCTSCNKAGMSTRVDSKASSTGITWAIICCFCGSPLLSCLVCCMDGFREFNHYCPSCKALIGTYRPGFTLWTGLLLALLTMSVMALGIVLMIYVLPELEKSGLLN